MKQQISPVVAVVVILVILAVVGGVMYFKTSGQAGTGPNGGPPPLPPSVGQSLGKVLGGKGGTTAPGNAGQDPGVPNLPSQPQNP